MLRVLRIKGISRSENINFGFDYSLTNGLNLISSNINTRGKSSILIAIYYCLGFEEIVGGKGMKTLTSVYKSIIESDSGNTYNVLESETWLEISNGKDIVTLMRAGKMAGRNENLISVYYSDFDNIYNPDTYCEDLYVHAQRSTTALKGFHTFLEKFIEFDLPTVPSADGNEYKLYMQLIFSAIFIEQKRGWTDILSAMPIFNIKESKKRVVEYLLGLDTLTNEKTRARLKFKASEITLKWAALTNEIVAMCDRENCKIVGLHTKPRLWNKDVDEKIFIMTSTENPELIENEIISLEKKYESLVLKTPKIADNYEQLQFELENTESNISSLEQKLDEQRDKLMIEKSVISSLETNLEIITNDLRNNKDSLKLQKMGSTLDVDSYNGLCPLCHQSISDSLLPIQSNTLTMSIEENIKHLRSQQSMLEFSLNSHKGNKELIEGNIHLLSGRIFTLRRLAKTIRNDLYSIDDNLSETIVYTRIQAENRIYQLKALNKNILDKLEILYNLSLEWKQYLSEKSQLPKTNFSNEDNIKIQKLENNFKQYLKLFNYSSVTNFDYIQISTNTYLPVSEGFDMKFDSSASDNIRVIWSFTLALLKTSIETGGNHPGIIIFDEPAQHSIVTEDVLNLLNAINEIPGSKQVISGITLGENELQTEVLKLDSANINIIDVGNHAFKPL